MLRNVRYIASTLSESNAIRVTSLNRRILPFNRLIQIREKKTNPTNVSSLFKPLEVKPPNDEENVGAEITGAKIDKNDIARLLNRFVQRKEVRMLCLENGLDGEF
jgi:hypothetical protein